MGRIAYIEDMESWEKSFRFAVPIKVRFSETDMFGHMNNTVPFTYFEEARIEFFNSLTFMQQWLNDSVGVIPVVANLQCDYVRQVFFGEQLDLHVKVESVGTSSLDMHYMAKNEKGKVCFVGRGTVVIVSKTTGKSVPWTEEWKAVLMNETMENVSN